MFSLFDKNLMQDVFNSNEFKGWLLSRRWLSNKLTLSNLDFKIEIKYFEIISNQIFLTIIEIRKQEYSKSYFLHLINYENIEDILDSSEKTTENIVKLTENTYSKKIALTVHDNIKEKIISLNLVEAEYCLFFWKKVLFDKKISEEFPLKELNLTLYLENFQEDKNLEDVQTLIEAGLFSDKYRFSLEQLGGGNTTNLLFLLRIYKKKSPKQFMKSYVIKSYKSFSESLEPKTLYVLVENDFPHASKIYGTIKLKKFETIGILEDIPNIGNLGDIYWNEINSLIDDNFPDISEDYAKSKEKAEMVDLMKKHCPESIEVSEKIGLVIKALHDALNIENDEEYCIDEVNGSEYLKEYTNTLLSLIANIQEKITDEPKRAFFHSPKIGSLLVDVADIIERLQSDYKTEKIKIQKIHQDLHFQQILYNKVDGEYHFNFIDFEGDPQLNIIEKGAKFPVEKDYASFLRSLSYIKFNTLLNFIKENAVDKEKFEVPEEVLYNIYFRKSATINKKFITLNLIVDFLNFWEQELISKIFRQSLNLEISLINFFTIERILREIAYELLYRPRNIIIPLIGLKEVIDKN